MAAVSKFRLVRSLDDTSPRFRLGGAVLGVLAVAGCDLTGQYDKKFQEALLTSSRRAVFDQNLYPTASTEVKDATGNALVKLRAWKYFDSSSKSLAAND